MTEREMMQQFEQACREQGLKVTHQRMEVFSAITKGPEHPSVEEIYDVVHKRIPAISLDTVYRTVDTFEKLGIVQRFMGPDNRYRFDTNVHPHHHLVCSVCSKIEDIHWPELKGVNPPKVIGWKGLEVAHVQLKGVCKDCRTRN